MPKLLNNVSGAVVDVVRTASDELVEMSTIGKLSLSIPPQLFCTLRCKKRLGRNLNDRFGAALQNDSLLVET